MSGPINGSELLAVKRLIAEGIIPGECRKWTLTCEPNAAVVMHMEVFVTGEQMDKIAAALADNPEEAKALAREIIFVDPAKRPNRPLGTPKTAKVNLP